MIRLKNYIDDLDRRLRDPEYAAEYLAQVLADKDRAALFVALKDIAGTASASGARNKTCQ
jgi:DNA-binding phage protein